MAGRRAVWVAAITTVTALGVMAAAMVLAPIIDPPVGAWVHQFTTTNLDQGSGAVRQAFDSQQAISAYQNARTTLTGVIEQGRTRLTTSEGKVADEQTRTTLNDLLAAADTLLADSPDTSNQADVTAATGQLTSQTTQITGAIDAVTGSHEQWQANESAKYTGENGRLDPATLCAVPYDTKQLLRCDAVEAWMRLDEAYKAVWGEEIPIDLSYRTYDEQVEMKRIYGSGAATPGTSNHGWAVAVDLPDWREGGIGLEWNYGTAKYEWMKAHAPDFSWINPSWAVEGGSGPHEPWHFEFVG